MTRLALAAAVACLFLTGCAAEATVTEATVTELTERPVETATPSAVTYTDSDIAAAAEDCKAAFISDILRGSESGEELFSSSYRLDDATAEPRDGGLLIRIPHSGEFEPRVPTIVCEWSPSQVTVTLDEG